MLNTANTHRVAKKQANATHKRHSIKHCHKHLTNIANHATVYADDTESIRKCDEEEGSATWLNSHKKPVSPASTIVFVTLSNREKNSSFCKGVISIVLHYLLRKQGYHNLQHC